MRTLVTGAAGFIGSALVARLKNQGHWVRAVDIHQAWHRESLYSQADQFELLDLRDADNAREACRGNLDRVYHLAADHGGAGYFYSDADFKAANNNLAIDRNVLQAAMSQDAGRLFFASSACTFPMGLQHKGARPLRETDLGRGEGEQLYGQAKRMSTLLMEGAREHGLDARSALFHTIYGPGQDYQEPRAKFPTALCRKLIENPDRIEVWGDGTQVRTFLFIEDALDRIQAMMEHDTYHGPTNLGSNEPVTVRQCVEWTVQAAGATPIVVWTSGPTGVAYRVPDNTLWNKRYGQGKLTSAREGFARTYYWLEREIGGERAEVAAAADHH